MELYTEYLMLLATLLAIIDIPGNIPIYLQQTEGMNSRQHTVVAWTAAIVTCLILLSFGFFGNHILKAFSISIAAFKVTGGIIVLYIAFQMVGLAHEPQMHSGQGPARRNPVQVGIFPLALPLFAGPGAIATVIASATNDSHDLHQLLVFATIVSASGLLLLGLLLAGLAERFFSSLSKDIMNRLFGVLVGALGIEFILEGLSEKLVWTG